MSADPLQQSARFVIEDEEGQLLHPVVCTGVEIENDGDSNAISDQCGRTSRSRVANKGWTITINGRVSGNDDRRGNLSVNRLKAIAERDQARIVTDIISGVFEISNTVISQTNTRIYDETADTDGEERTYEFQLQMGEEESES